MRIANLADRAVLVVDDETAVDIAEASGGRFGPSPRAVFEAWDDFTVWAAEADLGPGHRFDPAGLGAPVPDPRQVFAIGLNCLNTWRDPAPSGGIEPADPDRGRPPPAVKSSTPRTRPAGDGPNQGPLASAMSTAVSSSTTSTGVSPRFARGMGW